MQLAEQRAAVVSVAGGWRVVRSVFGWTLAGLFALFLLDAALFRTNLYLPYLEANSSAGTMELRLYHELHRPRQAPHEVLVLGNSRIAEGFANKLANEVAQGSGYYFASAAVPGMTYRAMSYYLRDLDPTRNRYDAIAIPLDEYSDMDMGDDQSEREQDIRWLVGRLRLTDVPEFALSFHDPVLRLKALRSGLFKGTVLKQDVREFLRKPRERVQRAKLARRDFASWQYNYGGSAGTLAGTAIDWQTKTVRFGPGVTEANRQWVKNVIAWEPPEQTGTGLRFNRRWLGGLVGRYKGTKTKIVFYRLPSLPFPIPQRIWKKSGRFVDEAPSFGPAVVMDERLYLDLESPENFFDLLHLNRLGRDKFTRRFVTDLIATLRGQQ